MAKKIYRGQISFGAYGYANSTGTIDELKDWAWGEGAHVLWIFYGEAIITVGHYVWDESKPSNYRRINGTEYDSERRWLAKETRKQTA